MYRGWSKGGVKKEDYWYCMVTLMTARVPLSKDYKLPTRSPCLPLLFVLSLGTLSQECFHSQAFKKRRSCRGQCACVFVCLLACIFLCGEYKNEKDLMFLYLCLRTVSLLLCVRVRVCVWVCAHAGIDQVSLPSLVIEDSSGLSALLHIIHCLLTQALLLSSFFCSNSR